MTPQQQADFQKSWAAFCKEEDQILAGLTITGRKLYHTKQQLAREHMRAALRPATIQHLEQRIAGLEIAVGLE